MELSSIINLQHIVKTYSPQLLALDNVSVSVLAQEFIGLTGGNGSGKSTLLKIIAGQLKPNQGKAEVFQRDAFKHASQLTREIGYISQDWALDPEMNGKALLYYFAALYGLNSTTAKQRIEALITEFDMQPFIARRVSTYSGGQMQRLHLAIGVIHQPKLLLLDEPSNSLDPSAKVFLWDFLKAYRQLGNTVLVVSHDLDCVQQYCSRVLMFEQGRIIADDTPMQLIQTHSQPVLHIKTADDIANQQALEQGLRQATGAMAIHCTVQTVSLNVSTRG
ncbi:ABC transporter ATP-binding protein [Methylocucumis oryzae]|uniref:ABC transporter domain-containing protein n=1 Tax=Methylocucumis oryzae TaxID=1632867 RepID=A0A0F3IF26_9GAMM|nr:ABC transporter ATP-binding protein [Methylocucumis oryzae]KJV05123.1 hypothetical protein VZ94_20450 [Methylocucumis oryzae]